MTWTQSMSLATLQREIDVQSEAHRHNVEIALRSGRRLADLEDELRRRAIPRVIAVDLVGDAVVIFDA